MALLRYNSDGSLDQDFGDNGVIQTTNITIIDQGGNPAALYGEDVAYQSDGKIIVIGTSSWSWGMYSWSNMTLVRYTYAGVLDTSFGSNGFKNFAISDYAGGSAVAVNSDGKIIAAGASGTMFQEIHYPSDFAVLRTNEDGSLDNSFYYGGIATPSIGSGNDSAKAIVLQVDGKIIAAGYTGNDSNTDTDLALVRFSPDGDLDGGFGNNGIVTVDIGPDSHDSFGGVTLQADGKIIMVGTSGGDVVLVRYHTDGTLDESFGVSGLVTTDILDGNDKAYGVTVQEDGKILVVGSCTEGVALLRYNSNGTLDNSFGGDVVN